ncbi:hypothetical protein HDU84_003401 [Entophlyctis sp. JEL0112]|nr:hypothetical protein HDU84_003401 [Entophlyctis sp. JEL0112]
MSYIMNKINEQILNVRWATEDPNPKAIEINKRKAEEKVLDALKSSLPVIGEHGTILDYQTMALKSAASGVPISEVSVAKGKASVGGGGGGNGADAAPKPTEVSAIGWDTPNGFFYASNAQALASARGAKDQVHSTGEENLLDDETSGETSAAALEGRGGKAEKQQVFDGAKYVLGVGQSRIYTGEGQKHAQVRDRIVKAAASGALGEDIGVGGVSQGGAGGGGVAGLGGGSVGKGGYWPLLPQQQIAMKRGTPGGGAQLVPTAVQTVPAVVPMVEVGGGARGVVSESTIRYLVELRERKRAAVKEIDRPQKKQPMLSVDYGSSGDEAE